MEELELIQVDKVSMGSIHFNKEAALSQIKDLVSKYDNLVIADETQVKDFKSIRAKLNNVNKAIDAKRKEIKKYYTTPLTTFENEVKEIISFVNDINAKLDVQIKSYEDEQKDLKRSKVNELIQKHNLTQYADLIFKDEWLNKTYALNSIDGDLFQISTKIQAERSTLTNPLDLAQYDKTLDLASTLQASHERDAAIKQVGQDEKAFNIVLQLQATPSQMRVIKDLFDSLNVAYQRLK